ncbi:hypothetical protein [Sandarakinorhabdus rubra]|uniref:hypothetical protein n=1 Tax=Sandarakinorhabdus rubra TaxID=2672568 RepID=UPI0013DD158E|nr:hypothetical protein [Sandarakinorhabdus rubra]
MKLPVVAATLAIALALSACATRAERLGRNLYELGVPERQAYCMGDRLARNLTNDQWRTIERLARLDERRLRRMSIREIAERINPAGDPQLISEFVRAGVGCLI